MKLLATLQWLRSLGREVVLVGPVPIYTTSVPLIHALEVYHGQTLLASDADDQHRLHKEFFEVAARAQSIGVQLADPIGWLCRPGCAVSVGAEVLYRDAHHLSVQGAMLLAPNLAAVLARVG